MKKTIDMMAQILEKNNIPLPESTRNKEGGSISENKDRFHALVVGFSRSLSFIIDLGSSRHIDSMNDSFSALHPYSGPSIVMDDDSKILQQGLEP